MTGAARARGTRWAWGAVLALLAAYSLGHFWYSGVWYAFHSDGGDFRSAFPGPLMFALARHWPALDKPWLVSWFTPNHPEIWNYGPVIHFMTVPFIFASTKAQAMQIILLLNYACLAAAFALWMRLLRAWRPSAVMMLALAGLWMNYFPLLQALAGREIEVFELLLISLAVWALRERREALAGAAIGLAAMTKFLPLIFVPYFMLRGHRKAFWVSLAVIAALAILTQGLLGFEHSLTLNLVREEAGGQHLFHCSYPNQSLTNMLFRVFTVFNMYEINPVPLYPQILRPIGLALQASTLVGCGWLLWRWRRLPQVELEASLVSIVMVLVAPHHANTYYLIFALPGLSIGLAAWRRTPEALSGLVKCSMAAAIVLAGFVVPMGVIGRLTGLPGHLVAQVLQLYSFPGFGAVFAALALVGIREAQRRGEPCPGVAAAPSGSGVSCASTVAAS